jgi:hypothetical protein
MVVSLVALLAFIMYLVMGLLKLISKKPDTKKYFKRSLIALAVSIAGFIVFGFTIEPQQKEASEPKREAKPVAAQPKENKAAQKNKTKTANPKSIDDIVTEIIYKKAGEESNTKKKRIIDLQVNDNAGTQDNNDKIVVAKLYADENLTENLTREGILLKSTQLFKELFNNQQISQVTLIWQLPLVDVYGNEKVDTVVKIGLNRETADKINWSNFNRNNFEAVASEYFVHPALLKNQK